MTKRKGVFVLEEILTLTSIHGNIVDPLFYFSFRIFGQQVTDRRGTNMTFRRLFVMLLCLLSLTAGAEAQTCEPLASGETVGQVVEILTGNFANWTKSDVTVSYPGQPGKFYEKTPEAMMKVQTGSLVCVPDSMTRPIQRASFAQVTASVHTASAVVVQQSIERPALQVDALGYAGYNSNQRVARSNLMFYRPGWMKTKTDNVPPRAPNFGSMLAAINPTGSPGWSTLKASFSQLSAPDFGSMLARVTPSSFNWRFVLLAATLMLLLEGALRGIVWYRNRPKPQAVRMTFNLRLPPPVEAPTVLLVPVETSPAAPEEPTSEVIGFSWSEANSEADASDAWIADRFPGLAPQTQAA
jgi:hypothetical protein